MKTYSDPRLGGTLPRVRGTNEAPLVVCPVVHIQIGSSASDSHLTGCRNQPDGTIHFSPARELSICKAVVPLKKSNVGVHTWIECVTRYSPIIVKDSDQCVR